jgi:hypothetical protein
MSKKGSSKKRSREDELILLENYIGGSWETCHRMRLKIDHEGKDYFYDSYTHVPVSRKLYNEFCSNNDCYCGVEGGCKDSEDEGSCSEDVKCNNCISESYVSRTPCCHFPLCEQCYDKEVGLECSLCTNDEKICRACKGVNEKSCGCDISE